MALEEKVDTQSTLGMESSTRPKGRLLVKWITSTDHKVIGYLYLITTFGFFVFGGILAMLIRAELFEPGVQIVQTSEHYNNCSRCTAP